MGKDRGRPGCRGERAVSEVAGTMVLIGVVVVGMIIVNLVIFASPPTTRIPSLQASLTNQSNLITIVHEGGDSLQQGEYQILVDGIDRTANFSNSGAFPWHVGQTLSWTSPAMPHKAVMLFNGTGRAGVVILETKFPWGVYVPPVQAGTTGGSTGGSPASSSWFDCNWGYRQELTVTTGASAISAGYTASVTLNHAALVTAGKSLAGGNDVRIAYWDGTSWTELSRALDPLSSWNSATTKVWFPVATAIASSSSDSGYYLYYGDPSAGSPPADWANVFRIGDDFNDGTLTSTLTTSKSGTASITETGGELFIDLGTNENTDSGMVAAASSLPANRKYAIRHKTKLLSGGGSDNPEIKGIGLYQQATLPGVSASPGENSFRRITMFQRVDTQAMIFYYDSGGTSYSWNGASWTPGEDVLGTTLSLNTYYIYELVSDGTSWYVSLRDASGTLITTTTPVTWANTQNDGNPYWFYWGEPYTNYYYEDEKSDWVYLRDYVSPEPTTSLGGEEGSAGTCGGTTTTTTTPGPNWYDCSWGYRRNITIDHSRVAATQANFPVFVSFTTDASLSAHALANGNDILFTDLNGVKLPHEIESYSAGTLAAWVRVPSVSSTSDTSILMYYGNAGASNQQNPTGVWASNNFVGVWHLNGTMADGVAGYIDSTGDGNTGAPQGFDDGGGGSKGVAGITSTAGYFATETTGTTNRVVVPDNSALRPNGDLTIEAWIYVDNPATGTSVAYKQDGVTFSYHLYKSANVVDFGWKSGTSNEYYAIGATTLLANTWYHVAGVRSGSTVQTYTNGVAGTPASGASGSILWNTDPLNLGATWSGAGGLGGKVDEVRFSNVARSQSYFGTEYNNTASPSTFYSTGAEESSPCGTTTFTTCNWGYRKKITIDGSKVSGTQTSFPVLVNLASDSDLAAHAKYDGSDIVFTSSDGTTKLSYEIESYTGATGKLVAWVKVPTLPSGSNTDLYLYYGNPSASNMQDRHGTWSNGYSEVWHLGESSGNVFDSAPAAYTGTVSGTLNRNVAGQVDGADEFLGPSTSTWLTLNDGDLGNNAPFTMSAWFYVDTPTAWTGIVTKGREQGVDWVGLWAAGSQYQAGWDWSGTPGKGSNVVGSNLISHSWYYGVLGFDGTNRFLYLNGSLNAGPSAGYYNKMNLTWTSVGNDRASTSANSFDGIIDEVRVSSVNRSAGWIRTEYNNQNSPGTFFSSIGSEEASPCGGGSGTCTGVVSVDATSSGQNTTPTSGITISHTTSGDYRLMLVGVSISPSGQAATQYVSSLTYNGVALTRVGTVLNSDDARVEIWKLVSPDTGTHNVVIGFNAPLTLPAAAGVMTFTGVDQTTVNSSWATATGNSDTLLDLTIPSTTGELAYGVITNEYNSIITDPGQTERWNVHINNPVEYMNGAGSTKAGAASVNMRWTFSSTYNHQAAAGISIRPCSSITPTPTTLLPTPTPTPRSDWYPGCGWSYRKNITIDKAKVTGSQSNFPVLISIPADTDLMNHARTDGFDILFTSDDGQTTIPYEREGYDSATGALTAWVNVPSLSSASNTTIYMYYGFPSSPDASHPELTWDGNYMGVWHMSAALADSTTYANTGTNQGSTDVSGLIGRARNFAGGSKQYIDVTKIYPKGTGLNITGSGVTIEAWIKAASWADWYSLGYIAGRDDWANNWRNGSVLRVGHNPPHTGNGAVSFNIGNGTKGGTGWTEAYTRGSMTLNTWYFVAGTYNGSYAAAFINGTSLVNMTYPLQNPAGAAINASNYNTNLGDSAYSRLNEGASGGRYFDGIIDEARISNIARSDSWISTEYANQKSPATFEYIGKEETYLCGGVPAPVYVQSKSQSYGAVSQAQITLPGTSTTGDLLVLSFGYDNSALTYFSVSDSKNNAWAQAVGPTDVAGGRAYTLYAKNIAGGGAPVTATITLSGTPTSVFDVILSEYAGVDTTSPLDQTSSGTGNSLALDSGAKYLSGVPQLVYGFGAAANAATVDSPYTNRESIMGAFAADQTVFSTGSYHVTGTQNVAGQWLLQMATFKGA